jgi:hypothetical protein
MNRKEPQYLRKVISEANAVGKGKNKPLAQVKITRPAPPPAPPNPPQGKK